MLTTIDLFCGAGGITEGFRQEGFHCLYANDINEYAARTFAFNHPRTPIDCRPIENIDPKEIRQRLGLRRRSLSVLAGGPPCQGFSINAPSRFLSDPRNALFRHYLRFLDEFQPETIFFENVPGILSLADGRIFDQILLELEAHGYHTAHKILFAAHYGVPQERWRLIILGSRRSEPPELPLPTHYATGRPNFRGGRTMTFKLFPLDRQHLLPAVTVADALSDLPKLKMGEGSDLVPYRIPPKSDFAKLMRNGNEAVPNHYAAVLAPQNIERLKHIRPGGSWRDIPQGLLPAGMRRARRSDHTKRYGRLRADGLAGTIMTKCDPHWGPVFLPDQDRSLTVREAARLQSFPDSYAFAGPRVAQYEQVGNAVPVLLARAVSRKLKHHLRSKPLKRLKPAGGNQHGD